MIPVFRPRYRIERALEDLRKVLESGWTGLGPKTEEFENSLAQRLGAPYSVAVNSCTAALHLALECLGLPRGAQVVVPDITFVSSASAVLYAGLTPRLLRVERASLNLDLDALEKTLASDRSIRAVLVVHYSGNACDMDRLCRMCRLHDVHLVEDCAHAMGSTFDGRVLGTFGTFGCFSFHSVKNLPIGDGGAVIGSPAHRDRLQRLRWMGIDRSTYERTDAKRYSYSYEIHELGFKYHMNDIAAVIGLANMADLDAANESRRRVYESYLAALPDLAFHRTCSGVLSSHHLVSCEVEDRDAFIDFMAARGVQIGVHYKPLSMFRLYRPFCDPETAEASAATFERLATLPCYPDMSEGDVATVIDAVKAFHSRDVIVPLDRRTPQAI